MKMMQKWLMAVAVSLMSILGCSHALASQCTGGEMPHTVKAGDTLSRVVGQQWKKYADVKRMTSPYTIRIGQSLCVPQGTRVRVTIPTTPSEVFYWRKVGGAPLKGCGGKDEAEINQAAWKAHGLTDAERAELQTLVTGKKFEDRFVAVGEQHAEVSFCKAGTVVVRKNVVTDWPKETAVASRTFKLSTGRQMDWVRNCANWLKSASPSPSPVVLMAPAKAENAVDTEEVTPAEQLAVVAERFDYDLGTYAGADPNVAFAGLEGAVYPWLVPGAKGRHAYGIGVKYDWWSGESKGFGYDGDHLAIGAAYKWSGDDGVDVNAKLLSGRVKENGHERDYRNWQAYKSVCLATNLTDASRERAGQTLFPEWTVWANYCRLTAKSFGHTWQGNPIADTSALGKSTALLSVGGRLYWHKNLETAGIASGDIARKLQPFVELGFNREVPAKVSGHAYIGVRTADKIWTAGVGPHFSSDGVVPGFGVTFDAGRQMKNSISSARWQETLQALEAAGISIGN